MNFCSNRAHNFVKHSSLPLIGRHGVSADFLTLSRDRATLGAIFTTTTRNLSACDVIMKMVHCVSGKTMALFKPWRYLVSKPPNLDVAKEARILCDRTDGDGTSPPPCSKFLSQYVCCRVVTDTLPPCFMHAEKRNVKKSSIPVSVSDVFLSFFL